MWRRMARLVRAAMKDIITQIITLYIRGEQKSISAYTTHLEEDECQKATSVPTPISQEQDEVCSLGVSVPMRASDSLTLMDLQRSLSGIGEPVQNSIPSPALHRSSVYGRVSKRNPLLRKAMLGNLRALRKRFWSDENKAEPSRNWKVWCHHRQHLSNRA